MSTRSNRLGAYAVAALMTLSTADVVRSQQQTAGADAQSEVAEGTLARLVRDSTASRDAQAAVAAGYELSGGCVSGPEEGAMGVHYVNTALVGDGVLDAARPEVLVFEPQQNGRLQLVAAEFIVLAEQWNASNPHPPVLHGQHFHFVPAPNRTGLPAYYELHVWAFKRNPRGTFADWNPRVSCDAYAPQ